MIVITQMGLRNQSKNYFRCRHILRSEGPMYVPGGGLWHV
jgi:hypothetical protein